MNNVWVAGVASCVHFNVKWGWPDDKGSDSSTLWYGSVNIVVYYQEFIRTEIVEL